MSARVGIALAALALAVLAAAAPAFACSTISIYGPEGRVTLCTQCCYGNGNCTTTCTELGR